MFFRDLIVDLVVCACRRLRMRVVVVVLVRWMIVSSWYGGWLCRLG